ncbi:hypothetical protein HY972_01705 [Candidatus Kaiserbacteria bacterium]|nr:hypothetical protein [Candidatus Kaiserbacteria bacterium]
MKRFLALAAIIVTASLGATPAFADSVWGNVSVAGSSAFAGSGSASLFGSVQQVAVARGANLAAFGDVQGSTAGYGSGVISASIAGGGFASQSPYFTLSASSVSAGASSASYGNVSSSTSTFGMVSATSWHW